MIKKNWISGEELKKRWGIENPDLLEYMLTGDLETYTHSLEVLPKEYIREMTSGPSAYLPPDWPEAGYDGFWFRIENVLTIEEAFSLAPENGGIKEKHTEPRGDDGHRVSTEPQSDYAFINTGATWKIIFHGKETAGLRTKGWVYIHYLVQHPHKTFGAPEMRALDGINTNHVLEDSATHEDWRIDKDHKTQKTERKSANSNQSYIDKMMKLKNRYKCQAEEEKRKGNAEKAIKLEQDMRATETALHQYIKHNREKAGLETRQATEMVGKNIKRALDELKSHDEKAYEHFYIALKPIRTSPFAYNPTQKISWQLD
jgi:hypothetical protein